MSETEKLYVRFGGDSKGGWLFGSGGWFIYVEPARKDDFTWLENTYKNKITFSPGKLGFQEGHPNGLTIWFKLGADVTAHFRAISDINRYLEQDEGWEKASESRSAPLVGEFSYRRVKTRTPDAYPNQAAELLKQLSSLRDAGILTEEEFQTKKAEILKRL